jgi:hypothetical protein
MAARFDQNNSLFIPKPGVSASNLLATAVEPQIPRATDPRFGRIILQDLRFPPLRNTDILPSTQNLIPYSA